MHALLISLGTIHASDGYDRYNNFNTEFRRKEENAAKTLASLNEFKKNYSQSNNEIEGIFDYTPSRDRHAVRLMFEEYANNLIHRSPDYIGSAKVLRKANETVGFISYKDTISRSNDTIRYLVVGKKHHKKGYGQELLQHAFTDMRNNHINEIFLGVRVGNINARNFYKKMGFKIMDINESTEKNPNNFIEMVKTFETNETN